MEPMTPFASSHVLIIEDDMVVGLDLQETLTALGYDSFAFASTARQALEQAQLRRPDLITADLELMDGDGRAVCLEMEARWGRMPVIYVTGSSERLQDTDGLSIVAKPFTAADIARALGSLNAHDPAHGRPTVTEL
jgi:DNA-binding response OmpR family regulator